MALDNLFELSKRHIRAYRLTIDPSGSCNRWDDLRSRRQLRMTGLVPVRVAAFGFPFRAHERWIRRWPRLRPWLDRIGARWPALSYEYHALLRKES